MIRFEYVFDAIFYTIITAAAVGIVLGGAYWAAEALGPDTPSPSFEERHHVACIRANHSEAECELRLLEALGK